MQRRQAGKNGPVVGAIGLGCMNIAGIYGPADKSDSLALFERAIELGIRHFDTADIYGMGFSETLIREFVGGRRLGLVVATKGGIRTNSATGERRVDNSPQYLRAALEGSLRRLGTDCVDLYYVHRLEPKREIEQTIGALSDLKREGKLKSIGLSEVSSEVLRRAHAVHPVAAVQSEYSLWTRDPEEEVLKTCDELGASFVAFSPLGRGMLTGSGVDPTQLGAQDFRRLNPRFMGENYRQNVVAIDRFRQLAADMGHASSALALAWLLGKEPNLIAIPGTRTVKHLIENLTAREINLSKLEIEEIAQVFPCGFPFGDRYSQEQRGPQQDEDA